MLKEKECRQTRRSVGKVLKCAESELVTSLRCDAEVRTLYDLLPTSRYFYQLAERSLAGDDDVDALNKLR